MGFHGNWTDVVLVFGGWLFCSPAPPLRGLFKVKNCSSHEFLHVCCCGWSGGEGSELVLALGPGPRPHMNSQDLDGQGKAE